MQHAWPYGMSEIKLFSLLMLELNSLLTLTFPLYVFYLLQAHKVLQWKKEFFGLLNKHACGLLRSILHGSYITHPTYVYYICELQIISFKVVFVIKQIDIMLGKVIICRISFAVVIF